MPNTKTTDLLLLGIDPSHARKLTGHQSEKAFRRYTLRSEQEAAIAAYRSSWLLFAGVYFQISSSLESQHT